MSTKNMTRKLQGEKRKALFRSERRRVLFGLEQRTNLRVVRCPRRKINLRHNLRRRGYQVSRASNEAWIVPATRRSMLMEEHGRAMGFHFIIEVWP